MSEKQYFVYIMASNSHAVLYTGVTSDLPKRAYEHREHVVPGFTARYNVRKLVYYEGYNDPEHAIAREKQIKGVSAKEDRTHPEDEPEVGGPLCVGVWMRLLRFARNDMGL